MANRTSNDALFAICNETGNYQFISTSAIIYSWRLPRGAATPTSVHLWHYVKYRHNKTLSMGMFAV